jgi:hypothetical protein
MKPFFFLLALICCAKQALAQSFYMSYFGLTAGADYISTQLKLVPNDGAILTGFTNALNSDQGYHVFMMRIDSLHQVKWSKSYEAGRGACVTPTSSGAFISGSNWTDLTDNKTSLSKISATGNVIWKKNLPFPKGTNLYDVIEISNGYYAVCGAYHVWRDSLWAGFVNFMIVDDQGNQTQYFEKEITGIVYNTARLQPTHNGGFIWTGGSSASNFIAKVSPNYQIEWWINPNEQINYQNKNRLIGAKPLSTGDIILYGGATTDTLNPGAALQEVICLDADGEVKWRDGVDRKVFLGVMDVVETTDGNLTYYYATSNAGYSLRKHLIRATDGVLLDSALTSLNTSLLKDLSMNERGNGYAIYYTIYTSDQMIVQPIAQQNGQLVALPTVKRFSNNPPSHEDFSRQTTDADGNRWFLYHLEEPGELTLWIEKRTADNKFIGRAKLASNTLGQNWQIICLDDGSCMASDLQGNISRFDKDVKFIFESRVQKGRLLRGKDNTFWVFNASNFDGTKEASFSHYKNNFNLIKRGVAHPTMSVRNIVEHPLGGFILFGKVSDELHWIAYLDENGNTTSEHLLSNTTNWVDPLYLGNMIAGHNNALLIAQKITTKSLKVQKVSPKGLEWEFSFGDGQHLINLKSMVALPKAEGGYIVSVEQLSPYGHIHSSIRRLYYISEDGQQTDTLDYGIYPHPWTNDNSFISDFVYEEFGEKLYKQTYDIFHLKISAPSQATWSYPLNNGLKIYPNPSADQVFLGFKSLYTGIVNVEVFDAHGKLVSTFQSAKTAERWETYFQQDLIPGIYWIKATTGDGEQYFGEWVKAK